MLLGDGFLHLDLHPAETEFRAKGKGDFFRALQPHLIQDAESPLGEIAAHLGMREGALKVAAHRLRKRFKTLFRENIADTLAEGEDLATELRAVMSALSR